MASLSVSSITNFLNTAESNLNNINQDKNVVDGVESGDKKRACVHAKVAAIKFKAAVDSLINAIEENKEQLEKHTKTLNDLKAEQPSKNVFTRLLVGNSGLSAVEKLIENDTVQQEQLSVLLKKAKAIQSKATKLLKSNGGAPFISVPEYKASETNLFKIKNTSI